MLQSSDFTQHPQVLKWLKELQQLKSESNKTVSDTISIDPQTQETVEYVDLVQEGGGMLGIALVGYVYILEQMGIRFRNIAGASAGAINATFLYALGAAHEAKAEKLLQLISSKNFFDFVDGNFMVRACFRLITSPFKLLSGLGAVLLCIYWFPWGYLINRFGLNSGKAFQKWVDDILKGEGVESVEKLEKARSHFEAQPLQLRETSLAKNKNFGRRLVIIASDITTQTKVEFPQHAPLYWQVPQIAPVADFVRASMSIPFFFRPFIRSNIFGLEPSIAQRNLWIASLNGLIDDRCNTFDEAFIASEVANLGSGYAEMPVPKQVKMVDGGLLSNFPINVFHNRKISIPRLPTFGIKLGMDTKKSKDTGLLVTYLGAMFSTIRQLYDDDFLQKNRDYSQLIAFIDTQDFNWLNFNMKDRDKIDLFLKGAEAAVHFYKKFDWESYKKMRKAEYDVQFANP